MQSCSVADKGKHAAKIYKSRKFLPSITFDLKIHKKNVLSECFYEISIWPPYFKMADIYPYFKENIIQHITILILLVTMA